jgi:hypothetical protein
MLVEVGLFDREAVSADNRAERLDMLGSQGYKVQS